MSVVIFCHLKTYKYRANFYVILFIISIIQEEEGPFPLYLFLQKNILEK